MEIRDLLTRLVALPQFRYTPDGKKVLAVWSDDEMGKRF